VPDDEVLYQIPAMITRALLSEDAALSGRRVRHAGEKKGAGGISMPGGISPHMRFSSSEMILIFA